MRRCLLAGFASVVLVAGAAQPEPEYKGLRLGEWIDLLTSGEKLQRSQAATAIAALGPQAAKAATPLAARLKAEPEASLREKYVQALASLGAAGKPAVPALKALALEGPPREPVPEVRRAMLVLLLSLQPDLGPRVIDQAVQERDAQNLCAVLEATGRQGALAAASVPRIVPCLTHADVEVRLAAVAAVARIDPDGPTVRPMLQAGLGDPNRRVRGAVIDGLGKRGPQGREWLKPLAALAADPESDVRRAVVRAAGQIDPRHEDARKVFREALGDRDPQVRLEVVKLAGSPALAGPEGMDLLARALEDAEVTIRLAALGKAVECDPTLQVSRPVLLQALRDPDARLGKVAIAAVARPNGPARDWPAFLAQAMAAPAEAVRLEALAAALRRDAKVQACGEVLRLALQDQAPAVRGAAVSALAGLGPAGQVWIKPLTAVLDDRDALLRQSAFQAILALDPSLKASQDALARTLKHPDNELRLRAVTALVRTAPPNKETAAALRPFLEDPDGEVRLITRAALRRLDPGAVTVPDGLTDYWPDGVEVVAHFQVRSLLDFALVKNAFMDTIKEQLQKLQILKRFRIDPLTDVTSVTLTGHRLWLTDLAESEGLLILRGDFGREQPAGIVEAVEQGQAIYGLCVSRGVILVSNNRERLLGVVERRRANRPAAPAPELAGLLAETDTRALFWCAVGVSPDLSKYLRELGTPAGLTGLTVHVNWGRVSTLRAVWYTDSETAAGQWLGLLELARGFLENGAEVGPARNKDALLRGLTLTREGKQVHLRLVLQEAVLEDLIKLR